MSSVYTGAIPQPADFVPPGEKTGGAVGSDVVMYARADHQHPRLTSSTPVTLDANGAGAVTFSRSFPAEPMPAFARMPGGTTGPCVFDVDSWVMSGSDYVGANVKGYRLSPPATQTSVQVLGINVVLAGQAIVTYGPASGAKVSVIMISSSSGG